MNVMVAALERQSRREALYANFQYHLAMVGSSAIDAKSFETMQDAATERYFDILGTLRPWEGKSYAERKGREFKDSRQQYIDNFGVDPLDPQFLAWEAQRAAEIMEGKYDTVNPEAEAERIVTQRLQEKLAKDGQRRVRKRS